VVAAAAGDHPHGFAETWRFRAVVGHTNSFLFQLQQTTMLKERAALIAEIIVEYVKNHRIARIGGSNLAPSRSSRRGPQ